MRSSFAAVAVVLSVWMLVGVAACGGIVKPGTDDFSSDAGSVTTGTATAPTVTGTTTFDAGPPMPTTNPTSTTFPAAHGPIPAVPYNGGRVLIAPKIVTVTFDGDTMRTQLEAFDDLITTTVWWDAVAAGYCDKQGNCIGHGTAGAHVHLASAGKMYDDTVGDSSSAIKSMIDANIQSGAFPVPDSNTLYVIYFPQTTSISLEGQTSCDAFGGYHNSMSSTPPGANAQVEFAYAILPRCDTSLDTETFSASHEIIEAATDPFIPADPTQFDGYGSATDGWDYLAGGEVGDRCLDISGGGTDQYQESGYLVQRCWSNLAAQQSHDPCVPAPPPAQQPYFNVAPAGSDVISLGVGSTTTIVLTAFSDGPTQPFSLTTQEYTSYYGGNDVLTLSTDVSEAQNGQHVALSITLNDAPSPGFALFQVQATSSDGGTTHAWSFLVNPQ